MYRYSTPDLIELIVHKVVARYKYSCTMNVILSNSRKALNMSNYPDGMSQYKDHPGSPEFDDKGLEDAHTLKMVEIEKDAGLVSLIISELPIETYNNLVKSVNKSLGVIGRFMSDALDGEDTEAWQLVIAELSMAASLPVDAGLIVEDAISDYAMKEVLS